MPPMLRSGVRGPISSVALTLGLLSVYAVGCSLLLPGISNAADTIADGSVSVRVDIDEIGRPMHLMRKDVPKVSTDGTVVAFFAINTLSDLASLYVRDTVASTTEKITVTARGNSLSAAISGDGNIITYARYDNSTGKYTLSLHDRRTHSQKVVGNGAWPSTNEDGSSIVYSDIGFLSQRLFFYDNRTETSTTIYQTSYPNEIPYQYAGISGDGRFVTFMTNNMQTSVSTLWLYDRSTGAVERITGTTNFFPSRPFTAISDDSNHILYSSHPKTASLYDRVQHTSTVLFQAPLYLGDTTMSGDARFFVYPSLLESSAIQHNVLFYDREVATSTLTYSSPFNAPTAHMISKDGRWAAFVTCNLKTCMTSQLLLVSNPFLSSAPPQCTQECYSNVLFLPGIEGSRLYRHDYAGGTEKLWEPFGDGNVRDLYLSENGEGLRDDVYAKERDILDEQPGGLNIYKSFIGKMDELTADGTIQDWEPIAYDWRLSLDDLLRYGNDVDGRLYYTGLLRATSTPYIIQELRRLAATSKTRKVTIVAHSNGGLLAKRLTEALGPEASALIDKMIFVAVPQVGTPYATYVGMHGQNVGPGGIAASRSVTRPFASTSPMFYHLLPSAGYFTSVEDPVVTFGSSLPDWQSRYGSEIDSQESLHAFLTDSYGRVDAETGDVNQPVQLKDALLTSAESLHADLDNWTPPTGVQLTQIAGWGVPSTLSKLNYVSSNSTITPVASTTIDGDGIVVVPSALWTSSVDGAMNYLVDLQRYNKDNSISTGFGFFPFEHGRILEATKVIDFVTDQITESQESLASYTYFSTIAPPSNKPRLRYTLHSPLSLNAYDGEGRHTGISTTTNQIEWQIPGSYYAEYGDVKYLFTDPDVPVHVVMEGYDTGTFTLEVEELLGDDVQTFTTWQDMPVTTDTEVTIDQPGDFSTLSPLTIDKNGDGVVDYEIAPVANGTLELIYRWDGFLQPINDTAHQSGLQASVFKAGSTVPVKFQLEKADGSIVQAANLPLWLPPQQLALMSAGVGESIYSDAESTGASYKWDSTDQQYLYNWSTKGLAAGYWYRVFAKLDDGTIGSVVIGLR